MSLGEVYPWLKGLHVAAALAFVGGLLAVSVFLAAIDGDSAASATVARGIRRWDQLVTTPALLAVWGLGLALALTGNWMSSGWLQAKLAFVVLLSGLHGVQSGRLRRLAAGTAPASTRLAPLVILCTVAIALLAVVKPF